MKFYAFFTFQVSSNNKNYSKSLKLALAFWQIPKLDLSENAPQPVRPKMKSDQDHKRGFLQGLTDIVDLFSQRERFRQFHDGNEKKYES